MAMSVGRTDGAAIASINVTPMADVIIVLLIIFMVTIPFLSREVDLPGASHGRDRREGSVVTIRANGEVALSGRGRVLPSELAVWLDPAGGVTVQADERVPYEMVSEVLTACRGAGVEADGGGEVRTRPARPLTWSVLERSADD